MQLYLLRHGETEWSRVGRKQGRGDSPLTPLGVQQAEACGAVLRRVLPEHGSILVTSPLGRAHHTARILREILLDRIASFQVSELLAEHNYGAWEGLTNAEIDKRYPGELRRRRLNHWQYVIPRGESYELVAERVDRWLSSQAENQTVVAVAHEMVSRVLRGLYLQLPPDEVLQLSHPHTCIYHLAQGEARQLEARVGAG